MITLLLMFSLLKADDGLICMTDPEPFWVSEFELSRMALEKDGKTNIEKFCVKVMNGTYNTTKKECRIIAEKCYRK